MKKLFSLALATIMTLGAVTTSALPSQSVTQKRAFRISLSDYHKVVTSQGDKLDGKKKYKQKKESVNLNNITFDYNKTIIAEINAIEDQMKTTTAVLKQILDEKSSVLNLSLKQEGLTREEKQTLKDKFRSENESLYSELEVMQKPFMDQIKLKQKQLIVALNNKNKG